MKKKYDKILILLIVLAIFFVMSWLMKGGVFTSGEFSSSDYVRLGLFDIIAIIYSAFYYTLKPMFYILVVGGCYGVLSRTKMYRKLVDKTSEFVKGKEIIAMAIIVLLMGMYVSISNQILALLCVVPFIITVLLRNGYNRLIAISSAFGGMFVGFLGSTYGTYGVSYLNDYMGLAVTDWIGVKIAIFIAAYVLYVVFAGIYMKKSKSVDDTKYDMFCPEELDESQIKKRHKTKLWPILTIAIIGIISIMLGYISWNESFGVDFFTNLQTSFTSFSIGDVPFFSSFVGTYMYGFGEWVDLLNAIFIFLVGVIVVALISKLSFENFTKSFGIGMKRISKVAFIYGFSYIVLFLASSYSWQNTLINALFGNGTFNVFTLLIIAFIAALFTGDPDFCSYSFATYLSTVFADNIVASGLIWHLGAGIALIIAPTSFLLLSALTYLDIPYVNWLKYIWKFILAFLLILLIILCLVIYV